MSIRSLTVLALRVTGIYAILRGIEQGRPYVTYFLLEPDRWQTDLTRTGVFVVQSIPVLLFVLGIALFVLARPLARWLAPPEDGTAAEGPGEDLMAPALAVVGVFVLADAIPRLAGFATNLAVLLGARAEWYEPRLGRSTWVLGIQLALQLAVGLGLFFRARGLAAIWRRVARPAAS